MLVLCGGSPYRSHGLTTTQVFNFVCSHKVNIMPINWCAFFNFIKIYLFPFIHWLPPFFLPERILSSVSCFLSKESSLGGNNPVVAMSYCKTSPEHTRSFPGTLTGSFPGCLRTACNVGYIATELYSVFPLKTIIRTIIRVGHNFIYTCTAFIFHRSRLDYTQQ